MKNSKLFYISVLGIAIGFILIGSLVFIESFIPFIIGIIILMVSIISLMMFTTFDLFRRDKELDLELLEKQGFNAIKCSNCSKMNILEDKFCIFCGEVLGGTNEEL